MPEIDKRISLGNILTVLALLVPGLFAFATVQAQTSSHAETLRDHEARIRLIETTITGSLARIDARLGQIEKELTK
jgi:outer membrane lipoprotein-sorting protein